MDEKAQPSKESETLLRSLSHDMKEPIRSIKRRAEFVGEAVPNGARLEHLLTAIDALGGAIRDFRSEAKSRKVSFEEIEFALVEMGPLVSGFLTELGKFQAAVPPVKQNHLVGVPPTPVHQQLRRLHENSSRLRRRYEGFLEFVRAQGGLSHATLFSVNREIRRVFGELDSLISREEVDWKVRGSAMIRADQLKIAQVLQNAVHNSVKYSRRGKPCVIRFEIQEIRPGRLQPELRKRLETAATSIGYVLVTVTDNGRGIQEHDLETVTELFNRGTQPDDPENGGGSGVGLSIAQSIVLAHHGALWLTSDGESWTTMHILLPAEPIVAIV